MKRALYIGVVFLLMITVTWLIWVFKPAHYVDKTKEVFNDGGTFLIARTHGKVMQVYQDNKWQNFFVKGINMGMAVPGKWFTEFPQDEETYLRWFEKIGGMNANTIRVYTLMDPSFYRALYRYNETHSKAALWLLQEIWPEENPPGQDYLRKEYQKSYQQEMENVINAIHGNANIPERKGRAFGKYNADVSQFILGYLVGRELEPDEVISTNEQHKGFTYNGDYLYGKSSSPTEGWLAMNCDYVLAYEEKVYKWQHPVAIVSWPTLDPINHDSEWNQAGDKSKEYNDKVSVDIRHIATGKRIKSGFFGAYHIYPNYPDFMNNEQKYATYHDDQGRLRYGGYLKELMSTQSNYPTLVAEFGLPTGMGNAHENPDGYNHGGNTEIQQGQGIVRMMKAIRQEGYMGGVVFEWMDEWAKKTWVTEPFMIPYDRHNLWHNGIDPEENYGIMAMESVKPKLPDFHMTGNGLIQKIEMSADETYLYIDIYVQKPIDFQTKELLIGLDTYDRNRGQFRYRPDISNVAPSGIEFLIDLKGKKDAKLLVTPSYNIGNLKFSSEEAKDGHFEPLKRLINSKRITKDGRKIPDVYEDGSSLHYGPFQGSYNHWYTDGTSVHLRLPWGRLNVTDPSNRTVLDDKRAFVTYPTQDTFHTVKTDGVVLSSLIISKNKNQVLEQFPADTKSSINTVFSWATWQVPHYVERLKDSYPIIQQYFQSMP